MKKFGNLIGSFLSKMDSFLGSKDGERCITSLVIITFLYLVVGNLCKDGEIEVITIPFVSLAIIMIGIHYNEYLRDSKNKK